MRHLIIMCVSSWRQGKTTKKKKKKKDRFHQHTIISNFKQQNAAKSAGGSVPNGPESTRTRRGGSYIEEVKLKQRM